MHRTRSNQRHVSVDINISEQPERCLGLQLLEPSTSFDSQVRGWNNDLEACFSERNARSSAGYQQHPTGKCIAAAGASDGVVTAYRCNCSPWRNAGTGLRLPTLGRGEPFICRRCTFGRGRRSRSLCRG